MTIKEIEKRMAEIKVEMDLEGADIQALSDEADKLIEERQKLVDAEEKRSALLAKIAGGEAGEVIREVPEVSEEEKRAKKFANTNSMNIEARSLLVSSGTIAKPTKVSGINDIGNTVSSIVDMVTVEDCSGMGADMVAYVDTEASAGKGTEGELANASEGTFGTVSITPDIYNIISYVSREVQNQSPLAYTSKVQAQALKALRKKAAGVVTDAVNASKLKNSIKDITAINATTLRKIVFSHGEDEEIAGNAVLFLNKKDLIAFGDVRGTSEKKAIYEIIPDGANPNIGVIKEGGLSVKYCINSNCTAFTGTSASAQKDTPTMFYGDPASIKLDLFGPYRVETSKDYQFGKGLLAVLGTMSIGSALTVKNGITVVEIPKSGT